MRCSVGLGRPVLLDEALQRVALVFRGHDLEQREKAHGGRIAAQARGFGGFRREPFDDFHGADDRRSTKKRDKAYSFL
jgi:hypothetical protein